MNERKDKQKPMSNTMFKMMSITAAAFYKVMNLDKQVQKSGVREGHTVLDFGCGSGHFTVATAKIVGEKGKVYALDIHPLAVEAVEKTVGKEKLQARSLLLVPSLNKPS